ECILATFTYNKQTRQFLPLYMSKIPEQSRHRIGTLSDEQYGDLSQKPDIVTENEKFIQFVINMLHIISQKDVIPELLPQNETKLIACLRTKLNFLPTTRINAVTLTLAAPGSA